jgi:hypothetical protein
MTTSFFQQYEQRRKRFEPGVIWMAKAAYTVQKLEILPKDTSNVLVYNDFDEKDTSGENLVPFLITKSASYNKSSILKSGCKLSWSKQYMEEHYKPIFESTL